MMQYVILTLLLAGCVATPSLTPAQELLLLREDYSIVLEQAGDYRQQCIAKPVLLQDNCQRIVRQLQSIHMEAMPLFDQAEAAVKAGNNQRFATTTAAIERIKARLEQNLVETLQKQNAKPAEVVP